MWKRKADQTSVPSGSSQCDGGGTAENCKQHGRTDAASWRTEEGGISLANGLRENATKKMALELTFRLGFEGPLGGRKDRRCLTAVVTYSQNCGFTACIQ